MMRLSALLGLVAVVHRLAVVIGLVAMMRLGTLLGLVAVVHRLAVVIGFAAMIRLAAGRGKTKVHQRLDKLCISLGIFQIVAIVAQTHLGQLVVELTDECAHAHGIFVAAKVQHQPWVAVQIAELDQADIILAYQLYQGAALLLVIGKAGVRKQIQRYRHSGIFSRLQRCTNIVKTVILGAVISTVILSQRRKHAHTQAVHTGIQQGADGGGITGIGIDIDNAALRTAANFSQGVADNGVSQRRLALTTLAKADHGVIGLLQMGHSQLGNLL